MANYDYVTFDVHYPDTSNTVVTGLNDYGVLVGIYTDAGGSTQGFKGHRHATSVLLNVVPQAISPHGLIVGWFDTPERGFLFAQGTFTSLALDPPDSPGSPALLTEILGVSLDGILVGDYRSAADQQFHGFRYDPQSRTLTTLDFPGATATSVFDLNASGVAVGTFQDAQHDLHAFRLDGGVFTEVSVPGYVHPEFVGITDNDVVAGNAPEVGVGFVLDQGQVTVIQVPGSTLTELAGIRGDGTVYGRYIDAAGVGHGFLATPNGASRHRLQHHLAPAATMASCDVGSKRWACRATRRGQ